MLMFVGCGENGGAGGSIVNPENAGDDLKNPPASPQSKDSKNIPPSIPKI